MLLKKSFTTVTHNVQMWKKKTGQEPSRRITTEPSCSKSLSRFACSHPTLILFQSAALLSPPLLSTTLSSFALFPSPFLCYFQTENGRWANAIHSLTKGNLGVLQQGSDRLVPQARSASPLTLPPAGALCVSNLLTHSLTHKLVYSATLCLGESLLTEEVI